MEKLMAALGDNFVGLWRYRIYRQRRYYVCTVIIDGDYYDSDRRTTPKAALREALRTLRAAQKKRR